ncbi:long-chain fatty acid--CoA ligase [Nakamurella antarctica]|uniref:Long-chain fatty acid--CoA ligase n=1 Tax=Nakamurella antarctica TaxID=1902245 RepID=A0A3G8ZJG6_9ACTN|nr:fatty acyl-AMP ligase [Nakamurella antarctica]AZI57338.1 long-chain fatty acid--CoA ligase [Nakamurella antarctica]
MSTFISAIYSAAAGGAGIVTGEPRAALRTSWADIHELALRGAAALVADGVKPGEAVAILAADPLEVAPAVQAVWLAGGSVTMLHQPTARTDLGKYAAGTLQVLKVIKASRVIVGEQFSDVAQMLDGTGVRGLLAADIASHPERLASPVEVDEDATALLQLTSGSTAAPKAVRISHRNAWDNLTALARRAQVDPATDVFVSWLPLFHDMGMVGFLTLPMVMGLELVKVTPIDFLRSPLLWFELISKYGGTHTAAPNFAYALAARVLANAENLDLSSLRFAFNGAEPIDVDTVDRFLAAGAHLGLPSTAMVPAYGMAETTLGVSIHVVGQPVRVDIIDAHELEQNRRAVPAQPGLAPDGTETTRSFPTLGPPLDGLEVQARDDDGNILGEREVGTLFIRGVAVTDTYLTGDGALPTQGSDGWLDSGDLGYLTDSLVVVCGRVKDVIIMGGRNIYPTDIERVAAGVDGVRAGNAIAVRWTAPSGRESFAVAVESRLAEDPEQVERMAREIRTAVTTAIGVRPAQVRVLPVGSIPKTPSGKLRRAAGVALID